MQKSWFQDLKCHNRCVSTAAIKMFMSFAMIPRTKSLRLISKVKFAANALKLRPNLVRMFWHRLSNENHRQYGWKTNSLIDAIRLILDCFTIMLLYTFNRKWNYFKILFFSFLFASNNNHYFQFILFTQFYSRTFCLFFLNNPLFHHFFFRFVFSYSVGRSS